MVPPPAELAPGAAAFYGVRPGWLHLWNQAREQQRTWYYLDNAYFDAGRERLFRVACNRLQHDGHGWSTGRRLDALAVTVAPWRLGGRTVLVCPQSSEFMATVAGDAGWLVRTLQALSRITDRPVVVRQKGDPVPFQQALADAWMVVTWSSAAAVQALMAGVPVNCAPSCAAWSFSTPLEHLDRPRRPHGREAWAAVLADNQWTLDELRSGLAWKKLSA